MFTCLLVCVSRDYKNIFCISISVGFFSPSVFFFFLFSFSKVQISHEFAL